MSEFDDLLFYRKIQEEEAKEMTDVEKTMLEIQSDKVVCRTVLLALLLICLSANSCNYIQGYWLHKANREAVLHHSGMRFNMPNVEEEITFEQKTQE